MGLQYFDKSTLPRRYDIAWCRFPVDATGKPGNKLRPVLVRATKVDTESNRSALVVSYGTTKLKLGVRDKIDLVIQNSEQITNLGLTSATRFDLDHMNIIPWSAEFFAAPPHSTDIVTGALTDDQIERFRKKLRRREAIAQRCKPKT